MHLDLRETLLVNLPCEISRLKNLAEVDLRGSPNLKPKVAQSYEQGTPGLLQYFQQRDKLKRNKQELTERLKDDVSSSSKAMCCDT